MITESQEEMLSRRKKQSVVCLFPRPGPRDGVSAPSQAAGGGRHVNIALRTCVWIRKRLLYCSLLQATSVDHDDHDGTDALTHSSSLYRIQEACTVGWWGGLRAQSRAGICVMNISASLSSSSMDACLLPAVRSLCEYSSYWRFFTAGVACSAWLPLGRHGLLLHLPRDLLPPPPPPAASQPPSSVPCGPRSSQSGPRPCPPCVCCARTCPSVTRRERRAP